MDRTMSANVAGMAGALAMMGFMMLSQKMGFTYGDPLPQQTVDAALEAVHKDAAVTEEQEEAIGMGVHLGFSMSSAMLYSRLRQYISLPGPVAGALFGLGLWGVSVAGVASTLGIQSAPWKQEEEKAITVVLAHLLFGVVVGFLYDQLVPQES
ncbi:MAG: hypothetical protein H0T73_14260 [Ardenticatenales bacterium]|nr:hypothetical protein [Ardenticatenales bacterium]